MVLSVDTTHLLMASEDGDVVGMKAKCLHCVRTACALRAHCVRTTCILRTQRLGYSPKNTCHLFTREKIERCQYHRVG